jgi:pyrroline-5-carboxylate reductase
MKLSFIGGGTMAEAILSGVLSANLAGPNDIWVGETRLERCQYLSQQYGVHTSQDNLEAINGTDLVFLAIKPNEIPMVCTQLHGQLRPNQPALSIAAGIRIATLTDGLGHSDIIRIMPNTPAQIGCGMSIWTCSPTIDKAKRDLTQAILGTIGQEIYVDNENYLDMGAALSGSGPAYVFLFIEALIDAGVYVGLPRAMARTMAVQTVYGSARLIMDTGKHPAELKDMVVSPGGTTAEGLLSLERGGLSAAVVKAVRSAYRKSINLANTNGGNS